MAMQTSNVNAPHRGRTVMIAPNRRINLASMGHPLASMAPATRLGKVALDLAMATSTATVQVIATSAYVNALTALAPPNVTFSDPPPGTTVQQLTEAYDAFKTQLATLQGQAASWIATSPTGGASIFSNLVTIAQTFSGLDSQVQADFNVLSALPSTNPTYQNTLKSLKTLVGAEAAPLTSVATQMTNLQTNLNTAASTLITAATTGVLAQLQAEYATEIANLKQDIDNCNAQISSDNSKIIGLGFAAAAAIVVGLIGLANIWNPFGWFLMGGAATGAYFAITEILSLKGQIAYDRQQIQNDTANKQQDENAAQAVALFAGAAQQAADMNDAAQKELTTLLALCSTLSTDLGTSLTDLNEPDLAAALSEWNQVVAGSAFLGGITAYIWPSSIMLSNPTNLAAAGTSAYLVSNSGTVFSYASGGNTWTALPDQSLSVVASGSIVAGIDGAPLAGSQPQPSIYGQSFYAKIYNSSAAAWTSISTTPFAQVATDGTSIWGISQTTPDRQVYQYSGSGTSWTGLAAMPNSDAPSAIAASGGQVIAIANNASTLWLNGTSGWQQIGTATYSSLIANGSYVGLLDSSGNAWQLNLSSGNALTASMTGVSVVAQAGDGDQYLTDTALNLWHVAFPQGGNPQSTQLRTAVVGVTVSDSGTVYALDNTGSTWMLTNLANNTWQQLPALPTS